MEQECSLSGAIGRKDAGRTELPLTERSSAKANRRQGQDFRTANSTCRASSAVFLQEADFWSFLPVTTFFRR